MLQDNVNTKHASRLAQRIDKAGRQEGMEGGGRAGGSSQSVLLCKEIERMNCIFMRGLWVVAMRRRSEMKGG